MKTEELKPVRCGCGGEAKVDTIYYEGAVRYGIQQQYFVECQKCRTRTFRFDTEAEAVTAWNRAMGERTAKVEFRETKMGFSYRCCNCDNHIDNSCVKYCPYCGARLEWT